MTNTNILLYVHSFATCALQAGQFQYMLGKPRIKFLRAKPSQLLGHTLYKEGTTLELSVLPNVLKLHHGNNIIIQNGTVIYRLSAEHQREE